MNLTKKKNLKTLDGSNIVINGIVQVVQMNLNNVSVVQLVEHLVANQKARGFETHHLL